MCFTSSASDVLKTHLRLRFVVTENPLVSHKPTHRKELSAIIFVISFSGLIDLLFILKNVL